MEKLIRPCFLKILGLVLVFAATNAAADPKTELTDADRERIVDEIKGFGLAEAPEVDDAKAAADLPAGTRAVVLWGGGKEALKKLKHLEELESLYLVIGEVTEADLVELSQFNCLKRLTLGMPRRYRIQHDLWEPLGEVVTLEELNIRCDP